MAMSHFSTMPLSGTGGSSPYTTRAGARSAAGMHGDKDDVELQVAEIQRKYRIMEGSRRSYSEDSQATIRRQRATIEQLKADNSKLKQQLQLETRVRPLFPRTLSHPWLAG